MQRPRAWRLAAFLVWAFLIWAAISPARAAAQEHAPILEALRDHDYELARARARTAHWDLASVERRRAATETWLAFLRETHRRAAGHHRAEQLEEACDVAMALLKDPPLVNAPADATADASRYSLPAERRGGRVAAPTDPRTTQQLEDLAALLSRCGGDVASSDLGVAQQILTQIVARHPRRHSALLELADAQWRDGLHDLALASYRRLAALRGRRTPARVLERIRAGAPAPRPSRWRQRFEDDWTSGEELRGALGRVAGARLSFVARRIPIESGYFEGSLTLVREEGPTRSTTEVFAGRAHGVYLEDAPAVLGEGGVIVRYVDQVRMGGESTSVRELWSWDGSARRFERIRIRRLRGPFTLGQARLRRALRDGDLERARGVVMRIGTSPDGGHTTWDTDNYARFIRAAHQRARASAGGAEIARLALATFPRLFPERQLEQLDPRSWGELIDLARRLATIDRGAALSVLRPLAGHPGVDPGVRLRMADALHDLGDTEAAASAYRAYLDAGPPEPAPRAAQRAR